MKAAALQERAQLILAHGGLVSGVRQALTPGLDFRAVAPDSVWEIVLLMVILKIPIVYLCSVVYYAIKAEPRPGHGAAAGVPIDPEDGGPGWRRRRRPRAPWRPHGGPSRTYPRSPRVARTYAEKKR